jgi:calcineurin-like phosphoesterase family protein
MSKVWFTSDQHFLHDNIIKLCNRPEDHLEVIFNNYNQLIDDDDYVFHLGDISFRDDLYKDGKQFVREVCLGLKGRKVLIKGNHDKYSDEWYMNSGFNKVVSQYLLWNDIFMCHYHGLTDNSTTPDQERMNVDIVNAFAESGAKHFLHGHQHIGQRGGARINISVDEWDYKPVSLSQIQNFKVVE